MLLKVNENFSHFTDGVQETEKTLLNWRKLQNTNYCSRFGEPSEKPFIKVPTQLSTSQYTPYLKKEYPILVSESTFIKLVNTTVCHTPDLVREGTR